MTHILDNPGFIIVPQHELPLVLGRLDDDWIGKMYEGSFRIRKFVKGDKDRGRLYVSGPAEAINILSILGDSYEGRPVDGSEEYVISKVARTEETEKEAEEEAEEDPSGLPTHEDFLEKLRYLGTCNCQYGDEWTEDEMIVSLCGYLASKHSSSRRNIRSLGNPILDLLAKFTGRQANSMRIMMVNWSSVDPEFIPTGRISPSNDSRLNGLWDEYASLLKVYAIGIAAAVRLKQESTADASKTPINFDYKLIMVVMPVLVLLKNNGIDKWVSVAWLVQELIRTRGDSRPAACLAFNLALKADLVLQDGDTCKISNDGILLLRKEGLVG